MVTHLRLCGMTANMAGSWSNRTGRSPSSSTTTEPGRLILVHTGVPEILGGRGVGGQLVRAAVARADAEALTVVPWCPFVRRWLADHPDVAATVTINWASPPPAP